MIDENTAREPLQAEEELPVGTTLSGGQFTILGSLGAGGFSITYRAKDNVLGRTVVLKECFPEDCAYRLGKNVIARNKPAGEQLRSIVDMFMREARSLAKLRHPNIVGVHRAFEENETAYMVLDLIDGEDLIDVMETHRNGLSPARVTDILMQLLDAIEKVHELDLLHRDISPDNIILEKSGTPVLIDFGAARSDASRRTRAISALLVVKDGYSPQEFYVAGSRQTQSSDLYALGATFYHLLSGKAPPNSQARMLEVSGKRPDPCVPLKGQIDGYDPIFLEAIDTAMQLHQSERLQSAMQWRNMIAAINPSTQTVARPKKTPGQAISLDLERSLTRLVEETNDEVHKTRVITVPSKVVAPAPAKPAVAQWVQEFNQDSLARETAAERVQSVVKSRDISEPTPLPRKPVPGATNWVSRAIEKQERIREERTTSPEPLTTHPTEKAAPRPISVGIPVQRPEPAKPVGKSGSARGFLVTAALMVLLCLLLFYGATSLLPSAPQDF
jgi:serine/threonine protein kinase